MIKGEPVDGLGFLVGLQTHGQILNDSVINSNIWHGKELGVFGDFKTKYVFKPADARTKPQVGTKATLCGKVVGFKDNEFIVEVILFDFCSNTTLQTNPKTVGGSPVKKFKFATTYATLESPPKPKK